MVLVKRAPEVGMSAMTLGLEELLGGFLDTAAGRPWFEPYGPTVELEDEDTEVLVRAALPGLEPGEVKVRLTGDVLTLAGEPGAAAGSGSRPGARRWGRWERSVLLPVDVDGAGARASFRNGLLEVRLPKAAKALGRDIAVEAA